MLFKYLLANLNAINGFEDLSKMSTMPSLYMFLISLYHTRTKQG